MSLVRESNPGQLIEKRVVLVGIAMYLFCTLDSCMGIGIRAMRSKFHVLALYPDKVQEQLGVTKVETQVNVSPVYACGIGIRAMRSWYCQFHVLALYLSEISW